jgi:hypothetical protein
MVGEKLKEAQDERQRNVDYFEMLRQAGQPAPAMQPMQPLTGPAVPPVERFMSETAPVARPSATGPFAGLTPQQLGLLRGLPRKEGLQFALDATKPEASPDAIKTLRALGLQPTLANLRLLDKPDAAPEAIRTLNALGLQPTLANLRLLDKPEASPSELRILEATGTPPTLENIMKLRRSGAASQTVDIKMPGNQQFLAGVGTDISKTLSDLTAGATAANQTLANVDRILPALDKAVLGPGADYRTTLLRVGQQLGIAGANANEVLAQTATVVQGLAQSELDAAAQMKGQGTLTDAERAILRRAAAGDQSLTAVEIQTSLKAAQKNANARLKLQQDYVKRASKLPGFEQFAPMYEVTPYTSGSNPLLNLIDQTLQQRQRGTR